MAWLQNPLKLDGGYIIGQPSNGRFIALSTYLYGLLKATSEAPLGVQLPGAVVHDLVNAGVLAAPSHPGATFRGCIDARHRTDLIVAPLDQSRHPLRRQPPQLPRDSRHLGGKTILVTGAAGEIGSLVTLGLLASGCRVIALDRVPLSLRRGGLEWMTGDLADRALMTRLVGRSEGVIHLAGVKAIGFHDHPERAWSVNVDGSMVLIRALQESGWKPLVFASSVCANFKMMLTAPVRAYGYSKLITEKAIAKHFPRGAVSVRVAQVVAPDLAWRPKKWEFTAAQTIEYIPGDYAATMLIAALLVADRRATTVTRVGSGGCGWRMSGFDYARMWHRAIPGAWGLVQTKEQLVLGPYPRSQDWCATPAPRTAYQHAGILRSLLRNKGAALLPGNVGKR